MDVLFKIESRDIFIEVVEDILNNLFISHNPEYTNIVIDSASITGAKVQIKNIILDSQLDTTEVNKLLAAKNFENEDNVTAFTNLLEEKKKELLYLTLIHYNCKFGETLNSFDWKLKLVCGTSELKTFSQSLLQLVFNTVTVNHRSAERLYEVNKDMLSRLIGTLEDVIG